MDYQVYLKKIKKDNVAAATAAACELLQEKGIENVKMTDVARKANLGVASMYRYFETKEKLIITCAVKMWEKVIESIMPAFCTTEYSTLCGFEKIKRILSVYKTLFDEHKDFVRFVARFDSYCLNNSIETDKLADYEKLFSLLYEYFSEAFDLGITDGSIRADVDRRVFYLTCNHALMAVVQKLVSGEILAQDNFADSTEIDIMIDIFITYSPAVVIICVTKKN